MTFQETSSLKSFVGSGSIAGHGSRFAQVLSGEASGVSELFSHQENGEKVTSPMLLPFFYEKTFSSSSTYVA